ncbi:MAG: type I DNA topoisomerase [Peptococcaceae bacterium]|nr:type I DNA topoisomerase [Peptococcaceae bacterium]
MTKTLVIVESPAKAKTIKKYLGRNYSVTASMGHVRDLPKSQFAVDIEHDFAVKYINIRGKGPLIKELKKEAKKADRVFLASDPDREGEAIAWHLQYILGIEPDSKCRVSFNEITKDAVKNAIKEPREINLDRVDAQQARRVLDRIVGYQLSPLLWRKVKKGLSAGRVQSVALRLICEREAEILDFVPEEYWTLEIHLKTRDGKTFVVKLSKKNKRKLDIHNQEEINAILEDLKNQIYTVSQVKTRDRKKNAPQPFTTSMLQQEANRKLNFTAKKTMRLAQGLYEGVQLGKDGNIGLITYMRTDSTRISDQAKEQASTYIAENYGDHYLGSAKRAGKKATNQNIQDAHEAIRPTYVARDPESVKDYLSRDEYRLYKLVWSRFLASQMAPAVFEVTNAEITAGDYLFTASGSTNKFKGYQVLYEDAQDAAAKDEKALPPLAEGDTLTHVKNEPKQHFTQPPARYTEASLIKTLEEKGIGRPSTYVATIETIIARNYVYREKKSFFTTEVGELVNDLLVKNFGDIINVDFTANLEHDLDLIEEGERNWKDVLKQFNDVFQEKLAIAEKNIGEVKIEDEITDIMCEKCGRPMAIKMGRYGKFLACTGFPECRNTKPLYEEIGVKCPKCGKGNVVKRRSKKGRVFYGCDQFPECDFVTWEKPTGEICPKCKEGYLVEHITKNGASKICSNKECNYKEKMEGEGDDKE